MPIQSIVRMGALSLYTPSQPVTEFKTASLNDLIQNMKDTMMHGNGIGIAAPQIGVNLRVIIFGFQQNSRYPNRAPIPFTTLINPTIEILSDEMEDDWEGCLSVPGIRALVPRYKKINYSGYDEHGNFFTRYGEDFHARVIQHEVDHLDGVLFPQRIKDFKSFGFEDLILERLNLRSPV